MNDKTTPEVKKPETKPFAVKQGFWLADKHCAAGEQVELTASQAKRLGEVVQPAKAA